MQASQDAQAIKTSNSHFRADENAWGEMCLMHSEEVEIDVQVTETQESIGRYFKLLTSLGGLFFSMGLCCFIGFSTI